MGVMLKFEFLLVVVGAAILLIGLYYARSIIRLMKEKRHTRPWKFISILVIFFFLAYAFIGLRFANFNLLSSLSSETIVAYVFFFGAIFVLMVTYLNKAIFTNIFGLEMSDKEAVLKFIKFTDVPTKYYRKLLASFSIRCDVCQHEIVYRIPDIVRSHPKLDRGAVVRDSMGNKDYIFYIRHHCTNDFREIPVIHDASLEYRSQSKSRII